MKQFHPGCFGSPLCHGDTGLPCTKCPFKAECGVAADETAARLRQVYRIEDAFGATRKIAKRVTVTRAEPEPSQAAQHNAELRQAHLEPALRPAPSTGIAAMPKKGQELYDSLARKGIDLRRALAMRSNPFDIQPPKHMKVLMDLLLAGGFSRAEAKQSLVNELNWAEASASSNAGSAIAVMVMMGAATEEGDRVMPVTA